MLFRRYVRNILLGGLALSVLLGQQPSGREYRRTGIHNGNLVRTVFGNWGVVGQPATGGPRGAWINDNNGYIGDVSPLIGVEISTIDTAGTPVTFHSVVVPPVSRPTSTGMEESPTGKTWTFEPVSGYLDESQERIAMSTNPNTWPPYWPDKLDEATDPGWRGSWNGFFGKDIQNIQQESYFVMDDNNDEEFNFPHYNIWDVAFKPDSTITSRNGLGLEVKVRGMQWQQFLAQDCLFWLYEVTNTSTTDYTKATFGMLVGTYVGVTSTEDRGEYDDDWSFFDVNDDITYTGDYDNDCSRNPKWVGPVGLVGYAFLESPGNPFDGIDNDGDYNSYSGYVSAPEFVEEDFDTTEVLNNGELVVLIDNDYNRTTFTIPDTSIQLTTKGLTLTIVPGVTRLFEGNTYTNNEGREDVNPNAYDGVDNDLDGIIDENYYLHYRQRRVDQTGQVLFDILNPRAHINFLTGEGLNNSMIDERRDDGIDNDGDWDPEFDDLGSDGIADSNDPDGTEGNGIPDSGEPNFDRTDVDESDQIGLSSFDYFVPAGEYPMADDEALWEKLRPGFFDTPSSISEGQPIAGEDGDFIYGSAYFPLRAGQTEFFSIALVYGDDLDDLINNKRTVQNIYNNDYRFPPPPNKPTLTAVQGDGKVTLYWDREAEYSVDPITKKADFQGYKIYRATDANFNDVRNITNAHGTIEGYSPIAQYDLNDDISGYFYPSEDLFQQAQGYSFYLGDNTGLVHSYVDEDVYNGQTYYYAVVAYDNGESDQDIFPAENSKFISILPTSEIIIDKNTAVVTPTTQAAGFIIEGDIEVLSSEDNLATGTISVEIMDEIALTGLDYQVQFLDTSTDSVDNDGDWVEGDDLNGNGIPDVGEAHVDYLDEDEYPKVTTYYTVRTTTPTTISFRPDDTSFVQLPHTNIIYDSVFSIKNELGIEIDSSDYIIDLKKGKIRGYIAGSLTSGEHTMVYNYYPILKSPYIHNSPWKDENETPLVTETKDSEVFDGVRIQFDNDWSISSFDSLTYWWTTEDEISWEQDNGDSTYFFTVGTQDFPSLDLYAKTIPNDYMIVFSDDPEFGQAHNYPIPNPGDYTNFRVYNRIEGIEVPYLFVDGQRQGLIDHLDIIYFFEEDTTEAYHYSWSVTFTLRQTHPDTLELNFGDGDTLFIGMSKPFRNGDLFTFTPPLPTIDSDLVKPAMDKIRVVPNPYYAAHRFESPLPPGIISGRGERKIFFTNVPSDSKIHIFTSRGQHVQTITHPGDIHTGNVYWNLKTKENLDIAFGVYFYIVDSPTGGKQSGKFAVIK